MTRRTDSTPRYLEIEAAIRSDIESGRYVVGQDLPTEFELCEAYEASRFTVREALRRIEVAGYIERHQGRASKVVARTPRETFVLTGPSESDRSRYVTGTNVTFRSTTKAMPSKLARELDVAAPAEWVHYVGVRRMADTGQPVTAFDIYLRREYEIDLDAVDHKQEQPILSQVLAQHGVRLAHLDETISATRLPAAIARQLDAQPGDPGLRILRRSVADEVGLFEVAVSYNPAERFRYHVRVARADGHDDHSDEAAASLQAGVVFIS